MSELDVLLIVFSLYTKGFRLQWVAGNQQYIIGFDIFYESCRKHAKTVLLSWSEEK